MNQRGIALPMALIVLSLLAAMLVAFALLAGTEPTIAANHSMSARARGFAESGVERAMWALSPPRPTTARWPPSAPWRR
jgi:Tfp pilus assembly protein PilX